MDKMARGDFRHYSYEVAMSSKMRMKGVAGLAGFLFLATGA
jgi:hypothetical protein